MKYVSLDLETTGLDPRTCQVIEIGMVHEDTEHPAPLEDLPRHRGLVHNQTLTGEMFALRMNMRLLEEAEEEGHSPEAAWEEVRIWLLGQGYDPNNKANLVGKNVGIFDYQLLPPFIQEFFRHRCIDPGSVFLDWEQEKVPSLQQLLGDTPVAHTAVEDAMDVIRILRRSYGTKRPLPEKPFDHAGAAQRLGPCPPLLDGKAQVAWVQYRGSCGAAFVQQAGIGGVPEERLAPLQSWCDQYNKLRGLK